MGVSGVVAGPCLHQVAPFPRADRVNVENREALVLTDADAQKRHTAGFVRKMLKFDFLPAERQPHLF